MGFQMRFCPVLNKIKNVINSKQYGKLNQVIIHNGENIINYHNYENYEETYAARKELGGGVILTQIHELDYFLNLFHDYKIIKILKFSEKISNLKLNVEDTLISLFKIKKKNSVVLFLQILTSMKHHQRKLYYLFMKKLPLKLIF